MELGSCFLHTRKVSDKQPPQTGTLILARKYYEDSKEYRQLTEDVDHTKTKAKIRENKILLSSILGDGFFRLVTIKHS